MNSDWGPDELSRADDFINLANSHLSNASKGKVSASLMFAAARYNSWLSATGFPDGEEMASRKEETIEYYVAQYREALVLHLEDYIENFEEYMLK